MILNSFVISANVVVIHIPIAILPVLLAIFVKYIFDAKHTLSRVKHMVSSQLHATCAARQQATRIRARQGQLHTAQACTPPPPAAGCTLVGQ
jgi:hypothetical protein